jgi:glycerol-3-phosphate acyltransferase PlsY
MNQRVESNLGPILNFHCTMISSSITNTLNETMSQGGSMDNTKIILWGICGLISYLVGAIPTGYLIARSRGVDIRAVGSGNTGATNVFRAVGKFWGVVTLLIDILKGFLPVFLLPVLASGITGLEDSAKWTPSVSLMLLCAACAIAGHNWPVYIGFRGGKGVATSMGALIAIAPLAAASGLIAWVAIFLLTRYVSLASMVAAVVVCATSWFHYCTQGCQIPLALTVLAALLVLRHKSNIQRLMSGSESRMGSGRDQRSDEEEDGDERPTSNEEDMVVMGAAAEIEEGKQEA